MLATEANPQDITLVYEAELRKWCLERAFETRALKGPAHMVVTNLAEEYYLWITKGVSQSNRQLTYAGPSDDELKQAIAAATSTGMSAQ